MLEKIGLIAVYVAVSVLRCIHILGVAINKLTEPALEALGQTTKHGFCSEQITPVLEVKLTVDQIGNGHDKPLQDVRIQKIVSAAVDSVFDDISAVILQHHQETKQAANIPPCLKTSPAPAQPPELLVEV